MIDYDEIERRVLAQSHRLIPASTPTTISPIKRLRWRLWVWRKTLTSRGREELRSMLKKFMFAQAYSATTTELQWPWWATAKVRKKIGYYLEN